MQKYEMHYDGARLMGGCDEAVTDDGYNSPTSDSCLRFARSHEELSGRPERSPGCGCSFKERLVTDDYWNWD